MIFKQEEYEKKLLVFVETYLSYRDKINNGDVDEIVLTEAVNQYLEASSNLLCFMQEVYGEEEPELPRMDVFFSESGYHDFAYRIYSAVYNARQLPEAESWRIFKMVFIGRLLHTRYGQKEESI